MITDKIYLVGFMAAGKTTLARVLARRLDWRALDIDELIEKREQLAVSEIFARRGEPYFRAAERDVLLDQLSARNVVVATGGGTFVDPQNRAVINRDGVSVWRAMPHQVFVMVNFSRMDDIGRIGIPNSPDAVANELQ